MAGNFVSGVWTGHRQQVVGKQSPGGLTLSRELSGVKCPPHPQSAVKQDLSNLMFHLGKKTELPRLDGAGAGVGRGQPASIGLAIGA